MKRLGKMAVCLAGGLALSAGLQAANPVSKAGPIPAVRQVPAAKPVSPGGAAPAASPVPAVNTPSDNPYAAIADRNIFGLNPPAPPEDPTNDIIKNLPKITLTGIQNVFGNLQALFKVGPKPGTSTKDQFYTLDQGERQDDIEVVKIDDQNSVVTFDNHGITQEVPLVEASASGGAAATSSLGGKNPAMMPGAKAGGGFGSGGFTQFGGGPGGNNGGTPNGNPGSNGGPNGPNGGVNTANSLQSHIYQPEASTMPPENVQIIIAAQHLDAIKQNDPTAPFYPPTVIDKEAGIGE